MRENCACAVAVVIHLDYHRAVQVRTSCESMAASRDVTLTCQRTVAHAAHAAQTTPCKMSTDTEGSINEGMYIKLQSIRKRGKHTSSEGGNGGMDTAKW